MNYEQKYKQALERAKRLHGEPTDGTERIVCEQIFPELKESEDEKVRKVIMGCCIDHGHKYGCFGVTMEDMCAWLEKQGEQTSTNKVEPKFKAGDADGEDERIRKALIELVHDTTGDSLWVDYNAHKDEALAWLEKHKSQETKSESKFDVCDTESEDERMKKAIEHILYENYTDAAVIEGVEIAEIVTWLEEQCGKKNTRKREIDDAYLQGICDAICEIKKQDESTRTNIDSDKVVEWLDYNICNAYDYDGNEISTTLKSKFKEDFGL